MIQSLSTKKQMAQKGRDREGRKGVSQAPRDVSAPMVRGNLISVTERPRSFVVNIIQGNDGGYAAYLSYTNLHDMVLCTHMLTYSSTYLSIYLFIQ